MSDSGIWICGGGAVGMALAAHLARRGDGESVTLIRCSHPALPPRERLVTVHDGRGGGWSAPVRTTSLQAVNKPAGLLVITAKNHANSFLARALREKQARGAVVLLQNGLGVEKSFVEAGFPEIYRGVLYVTAQREIGGRHIFRSIASSPVGIIRGRESALAACVTALDSPGFPFHAEENIEREAWAKSIINAVFNSLCPLLDTDNGVFAREMVARSLAAEIVAECVSLAEHRGIPLQESNIMERLLQISRGGEGMLISTLQDIRSGRETEIESLNLAFARIAAADHIETMVATTTILGRLVLAKSLMSPRETPHG